MAARSSIDVSGWLQEQLAQASPDLLREMVKTFAETLMSAEAEATEGCRPVRPARISSRAAAPDLRHLATAVAAASTVPIGSVLRMMATAAAVNGLSRDPE